MVVDLLIEDGRGLLVEVRGHVVGAHQSLALVQPLTNLVSIQMNFCILITFLVKIFLIIIIHYADESVSKWENVEPHGLLILIDGSAFACGAHFICLNYKQ